ncbi:MAG: chromosomal replication initiator protein DnaA [Planctomycetota bacterium]|nr:chromosomal replication initiator protein DnaA [Planctomycetota bacterium]
MNDPDRHVWDGILAHLRKHNPAICRQWFDEIESLGVESGMLLLRAQTNVHRDYLRRACNDAFNDATRTFTGRLLSIRFLGPEDEVPRVRTSSPSSASPSSATSPGAAPAMGSGSGLLGNLGGSSGSGSGFGSGGGQNSHLAANSGASAGASPAHHGTANGVHERAGAPTHDASAASRSQPIASRFPATPSPRSPSSIEVKSRGLGGSGGLSYDDALVINPDYSFDYFVVGPENRLAHAAAVAVSASPGRAYNPLFIHGGVGLGKTHLLQAVCLRILHSNPSAVVYYLSCENFTSRFMESVQVGEMIDFRHRFREVDVLVVDDIHFLAKRDRTQEEFFHTFNSLYQANKQIVLSSDAKPEEIPDLEDRLVSRFNWGLVAHVDRPCYDTRVEILKRKAAMRGMTMPDDVACLVASRIEANIRELEGTIGKIQMLASLDNRPVDLELAKLAIGEPAEPVVAAGPSIQSIIGIVTDFYRVRAADLLSKRRQRSVALPRQIGMYLARRHTRHSLEEIGLSFGGRDHTTVMHAVRTVDSRRGTDKEFDTVVRSLEDRVRTDRPGAGGGSGSSPGGSHRS